MSFELTEECEVTLDFNYGELARRVCAFCLESEEFPYEAEITLTLTDDEGIRTINREYRGLDRPTDVLSFPMLSYESAGDFAFLSEEREEDFNPDSGEVMLGDIVISAERLLAQAEEYGHSAEREFAFLIVHSMLHLFGYDHIEPGDATVMEEKQRQILDRMGIVR